MHLATSTDRLALPVGNGFSLGARAQPAFTVLTGGTAGTEVSAVRVIDTLNTNFDIGGAAAEALALSVILAGFLFIYIKFVSKRVTEES